MIKFFLGLFLASSSLPAALGSEAADCIESDGKPLQESSFTNLAASFIRKNCHLNTNFISDKVAAIGNVNETCDNCRKQFLSAATADKDKEKIERSRKNAYVNVLYNELQKSVTATLFDVMAQRNMDKTTSTFSNAISACQTDDFIAQVSKCKNLTEAGINITELTTRIGNEIAKMLSPREINVQGFINRENSGDNQCAVSESQSARLMAISIEKLLTSDVVNEMKTWSGTIDPKISRKDFMIQLSQKFQNVAIVKELKFHPLLASLQQEPQKFLTFIKNIQTSQNPEKHHENLKKALYTVDNGNFFDKDLANRCNTTFNTFKSKVCDPLLNGKKLNLGPLGNYEKLLDGQSFDDNEEFASSPENIEKNFDLLSFCDTASTKKDLKDSLNAINEWMPISDHEPSLSVYSKTRHTEQLASPRANICRVLNNPNINCENSGIVACKMQELLKLNNSSESNRERFLAGSTDTGINQILRSFVGSPSNLSPMVKEVLTSNGILPNSSGSFADPDAIVSNAIKNNANSSNVSTSNIDSPKTTNGNSTAFAQSAIPSRFEISDKFSQADDANKNISNEDENSDELKNLNDQERTDMRRVRSEIERRLSQFDSAKVTRPEVARTTREALKRNKQKLSPAQESRMVDQIMESSQSTASSPNIAQGSTSTQSTGSARLGNDIRTQTKAERDRQAALSGMSGARGSASGSSAPGTDRSPASQSEVEAEANIPTVAVYVKGSDVGMNLEIALTEQMTSKISDNFKLELIASGTQEKLQYNISKSGTNLQVKLIGSSTSGQQYVARIQELVNRLYREKSRTARLSDLSEISRLKPSRP